MTTGLPPELTAATGMDALTHTVETMAHPNINHFAMAHAITSAKLILENLPGAVASGAELQPRQAMLNASAMTCNPVLADFGAAVPRDPLSAFLPLPAEVIASVCRRACGWS